MRKEIDARGLACPAPVLRTKELIEKEASNLITVVVDNEAARQNVMRFLESRGFKVSVEKVGTDFQVMGEREGREVDPSCNVFGLPDIVNKKNMVMVASDRIGHGDDELGSKLMAAFLKTLKEMGSELWRLVFLNNGVKLTVEGSNVLPDLKELEENNVSILVCGTCLAYFNILDKKMVGETTNMLDIVTSMHLADKVINI